MCRTLVSAQKSFQVSSEALSESSKETTNEAAASARGELGLHFEIHGEGCEELCHLIQIYPNSHFYIMMVRIFSDFYGALIFHDVWQAVSAGKTS